MNRCGAVRFCSALRATSGSICPSGLTVIARPMPDYSAAHVILATHFGSIDQDFVMDGRAVHLPSGTAHFLEHKMFEDEDGDAFAKFARTGANANAFTVFDRTCYLFTATSQLEESLDVLLQMVTHPYFTAETIAKEQGIIGQEIKMYDDSPDWRLMNTLLSCLYEKHPIREDIAGSCESIAQLTPELLYDCCRAFYQPGNLVLAAAGNITMEQLLAACARAGWTSRARRYRQKGSGRQNHLPWRSRKRPCICGAMAVAGHRV